MSIPLYESSHKQIATLTVNALFIPYSLCKPFGNRPPLMHMAAIINDVPLLKRAIDVDDRGDLWEFNVFQRTAWELGLQPAHNRVCLQISPDLRVFGSSARAAHVYRDQRHAAEVFACPLFEIETCCTTRRCAETRSTSTSL